MRKGKRQRGWAMGHRWRKNWKRNIVGSGRLVTTEEEKKKETRWWLVFQIRVCWEEKRP
ncbi:hypothetical protein SLEP1_g27300 [Rubroshorea leprosula]|uniref:Uncharacterized protein n=1 Tax=Rubroshorea leprosula TaxID=152421 RepID=A0AAV5K1A9_9ROSI|nr:hypothetical protein SLEP1_g27300 [Rubroshorea leprosula]